MCVWGPKRFSSFSLFLVPSNILFRKEYSLCMFQNLNFTCKNDLPFSILQGQHPLYYCQVFNKDTIFTSLVKRQINCFIVLVTLCLYSLSLFQCVQPKQIITSMIMSLSKYVNYCGLSVIGCCFRSHRGFLPGSVYDGQDSKAEDNPIILDTSHMGRSSLLFKTLQYLIIYTRFQLGNNVVCQRNVQQ